MTIINWRVVFLPFTPFLVTKIDNSTAQTSRGKKYHLVSQLWRGHPLLPQGLQHLQHKVVCCWWSERNKTVRGDINTKRILIQGGSHASQWLLGKRWTNAPDTLLVWLSTSTLNMINHLRFSVTFVFLSFFLSYVMARTPHGKPPRIAPKLQWTSE